MSDIGHNLPPGMIDTANEVSGAVSRWLEDHPVIEDEEIAREAKLQLDRIKLCGKDLEDERKSKVEPLNIQVKDINNSYKPSQTIIGAILNEIGRRLTSFLAKKEAKRIKAAEEARREVDEAERIAREAEAHEQELKAEADHGVVVDVTEASQIADETFAAYQKTKRLLALAEREKRVKIGGGISRSLGLKNKETLVVLDAGEAIDAIGMTPDLEAAILKGARAYRTIHGELPKGIISRMERSV